MILILCRLVFHDHSADYNQLLSTCMSKRSPLLVVRLRTLLIKPIHDACCVLWAIRPTIHAMGQCSSRPKQKRSNMAPINLNHEDVTTWKRFPRYCPFAKGIHRSSVDSPHKGQWRGALMFSFICAWTNDWASNRDAGDLRRHRAHHDVTVMIKEPSNG